MGKSERFHELVESLSALSYFVIRIDGHKAIFRRTSLRISALSNFPQVRFNKPQSLRQQAETTADDETRRYEVEHSDEYSGPYASGDKPRGHDKSGWDSDERYEKGKDHSHHRTEADHPDCKIGKNSSRVVEYGVARFAVASNKRGNSTKCLEACGPIFTFPLQGRV
jgi:hypothetical protein